MVFRRKTLLFVLFDFGFVRDISNSWNFSSDYRNVFRNLFLQYIAHINKVIFCTKTIFLFQLTLFPHAFGFLLDFLCSGIQFYLLLSPYLCFISFLYLNSYVQRDDALISWGSLMQTKHLCVLFHI